MDALQARRLTRHGPGAYRRARHERMGRCHSCQLRVPAWPQLAAEVQGPEAQVGEPDPEGAPAPPALLTACGCSVAAESAATLQAMNPLVKVGAQPASMLAWLTGADAPTRSQQAFLQEHTLILLAGADLATQVLPAATGL